MARSSTRTPSASPAKAAPKSAAPAKEAPPAASEPEQAAEAAAPEVVKFNKRDLLTRVSIAAGVRRRVARPVMEAMLAELGDALSRGEQLNLEPFGKAMVNRSREGANSEVLIVKVRRAKPGPEDAAPPTTDPLAEAAE